LFLNQSKDVAVIPKAENSMSNDLSFDTHFQAGLKQFRSEKFAESLEEFFLAAAIDSSSSELHYYIGEALEKHRKQLLAKSQLLDAVIQPGIGTPTNYTDDEGKRRAVRRYQTEIPIIVVAYDSSGKFFAELALTRVTSTKGACIELQRHLKVGGQLMLFSLDSSNTVQALVRNVELDSNRSRYQVGIEFSNGHVNWLLPAPELPLQKSD
jgi:hypothetical protein